MRKRLRLLWSQLLQKPHHTLSPTDQLGTFPPQRTTRSASKQQKPMQKAKKPRRRAGDGGYCHQCRRMNSYDKMRCSSTRADGLLCALLFCENCILKRYSEIDFDPLAADFVCPKCTDVCNCTICARKRGEKYVSTMHAKTGLELAPRNKARKRKRAKMSVSDEDIIDFDGDGSQSDVQLDTQDIVPASFAVGEHWGAVYDLSGRKRLGVGIVVDALSQGIVLKTTESDSISNSQARKHTCVGEPPPTMQSKVVEDAEHRSPGRVYVGEGEFLVGNTRYRSLDAYMCIEGALTPIPSDGEDEVQVTANQ
ncbi:hypothetical protein BC835DRAFT_1357787 [Cytidiella melzeri]|nr:hypothetical protein BC835DRAFT_1357787 [Cytidiella melzeri]